MKLIRKFLLDNEQFGFMENINSRTEVRII